MKTVVVFQEETLTRLHKAPSVPRAAIAQRVGELESKP